MKHHFRSLIPALAILATSCHGPPKAPADGASTQGSTVLTIPLLVRTASGRTQDFIVEVARTPEEQQRGLMHRKALPAKRGMIFPFTLPRTASFWMKDTLLPLDLLFVRPDGTIAAVLPGKAEDLTPISAGEPVSGVVEIAGGSAKALGIAPGDHVQWGGCAVEPARADPNDPLGFCPTMR